MFFILTPHKFKTYDQLLPRGGDLTFRYWTHQLTSTRWVFG